MAARHEHRVAESTLADDALLLRLGRLQPLRRLLQPSLPDAREGSVHRALEGGQLVLIQPRDLGRVALHPPQANRRSRLSLPRPARVALRVGGQSPRSRLPPPRLGAFPRRSLFSLVCSGDARLRVRLCRCRFCCRFRLRLCCRRRCRCRRNETCILCPQRAGRCLCVGQLGRQVRSLLLQTGDGGGGGGGLGCRRLQLASQVADLRLRLARRELGGCPRLVGRACRRVGRFSRLVDAAPRHRPHTRHRLLVTRLPLALSQRRLCRLRTRLTPH
mmetsp:Transcript_1233/g.3940  ORF Transcript_1233/g.3940 Transcript_1233/m.3940 type:complete len:274 (+) Transcript_1233:252-1073(+)